MWGACTGIDTALERLYKASSGLQSKIIGNANALPVPALCQALCIVLSGSQTAASFMHIVIRSAILNKVGKLTTSL